MFYFLLIATALLSATQHSLHNSQECWELTASSQEETRTYTMRHTAKERSLCLELQDERTRIEAYVIPDPIWREEPVLLASLCYTNLQTQQEQKALFYGKIVQKSEDRFEAKVLLQHKGESFIELFVYSLPRPRFKTPTASIVGHTSTTQISADSRDPLAPLSLYYDKKITVPLGMPYAIERYIVSVEIKMHSMEKFEMFARRSNKPKDKGMLVTSKSFQFNYTPAPEQPLRASEAFWSVQKDTPKFRVEHTTAFQQRGQDFRLNIHKRYVAKDPSPSYDFSIFFSVDMPILLTWSRDPQHFVTCSYECCESVYKTTMLMHIHTDESNNSRGWLQFKLRTSTETFLRDYSESTVSGKELLFRTYVQAPLSKCPSKASPALKYNSFFWTKEYPGHRVYYTVLYAIPGTNNHIGVHIPEKQNCLHLIAHIEGLPPFTIYTTYWPIDYLPKPAQAPRCRPQRKL